VEKAGAGLGSGGVEALHAETSVLDGIRDCGHHAWAILGGDNDLSVEEPLALLAPGNADEALGVEGRRGQMWAHGAVDADASAPGGVAHDLVAPDGLAALGQDIEHAHIVIHEHRVVAEGRGLVLDLAVALGQQGFQQLVGGDAVESRGRVEGLPTGEVQLLEPSF